MMGLKSGTNFIKANINGVKRYQKGPNNTDKGQFTKSDYGEIPMYLDTVKNQITQEKEYFQMISDSQKPKVYREEMAGCQKEQLIKDLKKKYDEIYFEYQVGFRFVLIYRILGIQAKY